MAMENIVDEVQAAQKAERAADAGFLWDFWYPAARSAEICGRGLAKAMLLGVPLVLGRTDDAAAFALRDACSYRGISLSYGRFAGKSVECSYHGWKCDGCSGQCVEIPSLTSQDKLKVERIFAGHYPCEEHDGYVWVYMSEGIITEAARDRLRSPENLPPPRDERARQKAAATGEKAEGASYV
jgi:phenylpropionate dioxygenase-like ring-hydroxylating dioxygenase large terminal subunit